MENHVGQMESGRCNSDNIISGGKCEDKLDLGEGCLEHDDCKSNNCESSLSCTWNNKSVGCCAQAEANPPAPVTPPEPAPAKENGESCTWDDECKSGRCNSDSFIMGECDDKLGDGEGCLFNDDCLSNLCEWSWSCGGKCCTGNDVLVIEI